MSVFKNPNGLWYARISTGVKGPNGRYKYVTSKHGRKSRGVALMDEAELRVFVAGNNADALSKIRNHELLDRYMATKGIRATTAKTYKSAIAHIKKLLPDLPARDTTTMHMEAFRQAVLMEPVSTTTHRTYISLVKATFRWAADNDMIIKSPARNLKLPEKTEPAGMHVPINILQEILQQVKTYRYSQLYIPLLLAGMCGLRISEICGLQDTDVTSKHIQVRFNFLRAGKDLSLQPLKTKAAARVVPVIAAVAREINEYRRFNARCKKTAVSQRMELEKQPNFLDGDPAWQESSHFFVHPQDGRPLGREYVERQWKQFKRSPEMLPLISKYPELSNMRLHDFRHSFGSNLRYAGAPIEDVTEILGHTNSNFTRVTYALPLQGTHERSMQRLETLMKNIVN